MMRTVQKEKTKIAMVTTWNCRCGIAEYSKYLMAAVESELDFVIYASSDTEIIEPDDPKTVCRCWRNHSELLTLRNLIVASNVDIIHFQFNFGFFSLGQLASFIEEMSMRKKIIITFHSTKCSAFSLHQIADALKKVSAIIVHQDEDGKRLKELGLADNVVMMHHGIIEYSSIEKQVARENIRLKGEPVIATFGFLLPPKGILEIIQALAILKQHYPAIMLIASCALYPLTMSTNYYHACLNEIKKLALEKHIVFVTDFVTPGEAISLLSAADISVLSYHPTNESSSAALRFCLAARRPLITTKLPIFSEVADCSNQIEASNPILLAEAIDALLKSSEQQEVFINNMTKKIEETGWSKVGRVYVDLTRKLLNNNLSKKFDL